MKNFSIKDLYESCESIIISFLVIMIVILFAFRAVAVDGDSMLPNLHDQEKLITTNFFYTPEKGDIVVIDKNNVLRKPLIKRVIATESDTIRIDYKTGDVYVNNQLLIENYILEKIEPVNAETLEMTIQPGYIFVLGDNRNNSKDSRSRDYGEMGVNRILGKVIFRLVPNFGTVD